ncbi:hypothetical protein BDZ91DRAFT_725718 [Kalaharituber pfeilii]|nr:hypothetical protein BDZ91DRAFT_725718 [Kalaharituber pfeilii]
MANHGLNCGRSSQKQTPASSDFDFARQQSRDRAMVQDQRQGLVEQLTLRFRAQPARSPPKRRHPALQPTTPSPKSTPISFTSHNSYDATDNVLQSHNGPSSNRSVRRQQRAFNLKNLPPRQIVSRCLVSFCRGYGVLYWFLPEVHIMSLFRAAYSPAYDNPPRSARQGRTNSMSSAEFGLLLLAAAVGGVYVEDCDLSVRNIKEDLFRVGKWYLDIAMSNDMQRTTDNVDKSATPSAEDTLLKISASAMAALYLIFEKKILARKYIEQAIHLAHSQGLHMNSPSSSHRNYMNGVGGSGSGGGPARAVATSTPQGGIWRSLVFLDGWFSASVGYRPAMDQLDVSKSSFTLFPINLALASSLFCFDVHSNNSLRFRFMLSTLWEVDLRVHGICGGFTSEPSSLLAFYLTLSSRPHLTV